MTVKELAKKLFAKVTGYKGVVTTYIIKQKYPKFRASNPQHWELLVLKLMNRNAKANKIEPTPIVIKTPHEQIDSIADVLLRDHNIRLTRTNTFMGTRYSFSFNKMAIGDIGYSLSNNKFYFAVGRQGRNNYVETSEQALTEFLRWTSSARAC